MKEKEVLRKRMLELRRGLSSGAIAERSRLIQEHLLGMDKYRNAATALIYVSTRDEVQTDEILSRRLGEGRKTAVPSLRKNKKIITPSLIESMDELSEGVFGIREPRPEYIRQAAPEEIALVIAPGAAFDLSGGRVGFGGGYYDRLLSLLPRESAVIALAFSFQVLESVPVCAHDVPVDFVVTEEGARRCRPQSRA